MAFNKVQDRVYIRDERFEWLPAIILNLELDRALVRIDLPNDWKNTTIVSNVQASNRNATADRVDGNRGLDKDERWVLLKDYYNHRLPLQNARVCRDMAELKHLHEAAILYQIKERHCRLDKPYTRVGEIIVAVNPCRWIHSLYSPEQQQFYVEHFTAQRKKNGKILITGYSGLFFMNVLSQTK